MGGHVLIIDDEPSLRRTLGRVLGAAGCEVATAASGPEALQWLESIQFDLVYLDLRLPEMSGIEVLRRIRRRDARLPVILFTAYGSMQSALEAMRLGASDYLLKPVDPEVLVARTRVVLQEQAVERRRREIQTQIAALQAELKELEDGAAPLASGRPADNLTALPELAAPGPANRFLKRGRMILDLQAQRATLGERVLNIPPASFGYLVVLARYAPEVVAYQALVSEAQGFQAKGEEARELSKWHIHVLRAALEGDPQKPQMIMNVRGAGYRMLLE